MSFNLGSEPGNDNEYLNDGLQPMSFNLGSELQMDLSLP